MPGDRVLVTGSAGHLGEALVRVLRASGRDVAGLDLLPSPFTTTTGSSMARPVTCNLLFSERGPGKSRARWSAN